MIDVLKKLQEIAETNPEVVKDAVENVQKTNPTEAMNPKQQAAIAIAKKKDGYKESLADKLAKEQGEYVYEKQKGVDGKVCWKGYKRMGTKKKGGKTVDNCVKM